MRDRWSVCLPLHSKELLQHFLVFVDCAEQHFANHIPLLILFGDLLNCFCVFGPDVLSYEWRIHQHKVEIPVKFFWDLLWLIEIVFEEVGVLGAELVIELSQANSLHRRHRILCALASPSH